AKNRQVDRCCCGCRKPHPHELTSEVPNRVIIRRMQGMVELLLHWLTSLVKSRRRLEAEKLVLRHQVSIFAPTCVAAVRRKIPILWVMRRDGRCDGAHRALASQ